MLSIHRWTTAFAWGAISSTLSLGQETPRFVDLHRKPLNIRARTLGGKQFWSDVLIQCQWRIQRNSVTGHHRLLDDRNVRQAWGNYAQCVDTLDRRKRELNLPSIRGKAVVALHGLGRSRQSMEKMCQTLAEEGEFAVINVAYASTRQSIGDHAANLQRILKGLDDVEEINLVAHSMGNLIIRYYFGARDPADPSDARIQRLVMLGPPNNGSRLAEVFKNNPLFRLFFGISGQEIAGQWQTLSEHLATPDCEFAIIAGGRGKVTGRNPVLRGDDDLIVSVEETKLAGARDFITVQAIHSFIMQDATTLEYTLRFLNRGYFITEDRRNPIRDPSHAKDDS